STIALVTSPHINGNEFTTLNTPIAWIRMWHGTVWARGYDGIKCCAISAQRDHVARDFPCYVFFGHAWLKPLAQMGKRFIGNGNRSPQKLQFIWLFDLAQCTHKTICNGLKGKGTVSCLVNLVVLPVREGF